MHFGLTFIASAAGGNAHKRWREEARTRKERLDRHQRLSWIADDNLTSDERAVLKSIEEQLAGNEPGASARACPECKQPFEVVAVRDVEIDCCRGCRSIWFDPGELTALAGVKKEVPQPDLATRSSRYACPDCNEPMVEYALFDPLNLLVDRCPAGHGVYLEDRELERVFEIT